MPVTAPNLDDPRQFERRPGVPILDVHSRNGRDVDEARLRLVAANSNARARRGEPALLLIGHTTDDGKETDQPPVVGFARNYALGSWQGRPCILADLFYARDKLTQSMNYPRRSVEVFYSDTTPENNYIDAVALLVRMPERDLGLMTYRKKNLQLERYSIMADEPASSSASSASITEADAPALQAYMERNKIADVATGIQAFLRARADGTEKAADDELTQADLPQIAKYMQDNKVDPQNIPAYKAGLQRYKADRKAGKLHRT